LFSDYNLFVEWCRCGSGVTASCPRMPDTWIPRSQSPESCLWTFLFPRCVHG
jgi:hypothetical protein